MIYLDNAATTRQKPDEVIQAVCQALGIMGNAGRGAHDSALDASRTIYQARANLATLFGAKQAHDIVFTANATESLNIVIQGVIADDDQVITTELEHNSVLRPLYLKQDKGMGLKFVKADELGNVRYEDFESLIDGQTKAVICTHASNVTGNLVDIEKIGQICRDKDCLFIVDASQTAGVYPIDVEKMNIDLLCFTGHKSLLGPQGTGGIYVREGLAVRPLKVGGSGVGSFDHNHPVNMPSALEAGTLNGHGIAGLDAALTYIQSVGMDVIREKELRLMWQFYHGIKDLPGITIYGDFTKKERAPIVSFNIADLDSAMISDELFGRYQICTRPGAHCAPLMHQALKTVEQGMVRVSFSHFNTEEEIAAAISAVSFLIK